MISEDYILTAAHCVYNTNQYGGVINILIGVTFYSGDYNGQYVGIVDHVRGDNKIIIHENYRPSTVSCNTLNDKYDIALIRLDTKASGVPTISIPDLIIDRDNNGKVDERDYPDNKYKGFNATLIGIGRTTDSNQAPISNRLMKTLMKLNAAPFDLLEFGKIDRNVPDTSPNHGDSGGPAIIKKNNIDKTFVIGVAQSYNKNLGYYTSVSKYVDWIKKNSGVDSNQGTADIRPYPTVYPLTNN